MNGFHSCWRGISAHESASTMGKKIANWTVGKSTSAWRRARPGASPRGVPAMRQSTRRVRGTRGQGRWGVAALVALLAVAPTGEAACGGVRTDRPTHHQKRNRGRAPLAVGDSVMLLAIHGLARRGFEANARGCRGFDEGLR